MNRIPKYRAWDKIEQRMCEVVTISYWDPELGDPIELGSCLLRHEELGIWRNIEDIDLMECIDKNDKNNNEIYANDIIRCYNGITNSYFNTVVQWETMIIQDDINDFPLQVSGFIIGSLGEIEVIGNIHQNPELLEATF